MAVHELPNRVAQMRPLLEAFEEQLVALAPLLLQQTPRQGHWKLWELHYGPNGTAVDMVEVFLDGRVEFTKVTSAVRPLPRRCGTLQDPDDVLDYMRQRVALVEFPYEEDAPYRALMHDFHLRRFRYMRGEFYTGETVKLHFNRGDSWVHVEVSDNAPNSCRVEVSHCAMNTRTSWLRFGVAVQAATTLLDAMMVVDNLHKDGE